MKLSQLGLRTDEISEVAVNQPAFLKQGEVSDVHNPSLPKSVHSEDGGLIDALVFGEQPRVDEREADELPGIWGWRRHDATFRLSSRVNTPGVCLAKIIGIWQREVKLPR